MVSIIIANLTRGKNRIEEFLNGDGRNGFFLNQGSQLFSQGKKWKKIKEDDWKDWEMCQEYKISLSTEPN